MRKYVIACLLSVGFLLSGCGVFDDTPGLVVKESGEVKSCIQEEFAEDYYDADELQEEVNSEIAVYNDVAGTDSIVLKKFKIRYGNEEAVTSVSAVLEYASAKDYEAFNEETLYVGSVSESLKNEQLSELAFYSVEDGETKVTIEDILKEGEYQMIMFTEPVSVKGPKNVLYYSEGLSMSKESKRVLVTDKDKEIYCIIYE